MVYANGTLKNGQMCILKGLGCLVSAEIDHSSTGLVWYSGGHCVVITYPIQPQLWFN
jgi:hypothetical protein